MICVVHANTHTDHLACIIDGGLVSRAAEALQSATCIFTVPTWIQYRVGIVWVKDYYKKDGGGGQKLKKATAERPGQDRRPAKENHFDMRKLRKGDNKENPNQFK